MTREEHLAFCKKCTHRHLDMQQGLICTLTGSKADFENTCENFNRDEAVKDKIETEEMSHSEVVYQLSDEVVDKLKTHQDIGYALIGGFTTALVCAFLWAVITVSTEYQIGYMAIGVGFLVGISVRYFGAGIDQVYGYIGGTMALLGCLLGNLFSQVGFLAQMQYIGYFDALSFLDLETIRLIYVETFSVMDIVFYGIAIVEGYKFAFRSIPEDIEELEDLTPQNAKLRLPLVSAFLVILIISGFSLSKGVTGVQEFYYESGKIQSRGELVGGLEQGEWTFYYENGVVLAEGNYEDGIENGLWKWYNEFGSLSRTGNYINGLHDSTWINYNMDGSVIEENNYTLGRLSGAYRSFYDNGDVFQEGRYDRDNMDSVWSIYHENGMLSATGSFSNSELSGIWKYYNTTGKLTEELEYVEGGDVKILNVWSIQERQIVKEGNGTYRSYYDNGTPAAEGAVKDGKKVGEWTAYYSNGSRKEVGKYDGDDYVLISAWDTKGDLMVEKGSGEYVSYFDDTDKVLEKGAFKDGKREGRWELFYADSSIKQQVSNYKNGKLDGLNLTYYEDGSTLTEGAFEEDERIGEWIWYYQSGDYQCTVTFEKGQKQGDQIFWSEFGREAKKEVYEDGELIEEVLL